MRSKRKILSLFIVFELIQSSPAFVRPAQGEVVTTAILIGALIASISAARHAHALPEKFRIALQEKEKNARRWEKKYQDVRRQCQEITEQQKEFEQWLGGDRRALSHGIIGIRRFFLSEKRHQPNNSQDDWTFEANPVVGDPFLFFGEESLISVALEPRVCASGLSAEYENPNIRLMRVLFENLKEQCKLREQIILYKVQKELEEVQQVRALLIIGETDAELAKKLVSHRESVASFLDVLMHDPVVWLATGRDLFEYFAAGSASPDQMARAGTKRVVRHAIRRITTGIIEEHLADSASRNAAGLLRPHSTRGDQQKIVKKLLEEVDLETEREIAKSRRGLPARTFSQILHEKLQNLDIEGTALLPGLPSFADRVTSDVVAALSGIALDAMFSFIHSKEVAGQSLRTLGQIVGRDLVAGTIGKVVETAPSTTRLGAFVSRVGPFAWAFLGHTLAESGVLTLKNAIFNHREEVKLYFESVIQWILHQEQAIRHQKLLREKVASSNRLISTIGEVSAQNQQCTWLERRLADHVLQECEQREAFPGEASRVVYGVEFNCVQRLCNAFGSVTEIRKSFLKGEAFFEQLKILTRYERLRRNGRDKKEYGEILEQIARHLFYASLREEPSEKENFSKFLDAFGGKEYLLGELFNNLKNSIDQKETFVERLIEVLDREKLEQWKKERQERKAWERVDWELAGYKKVLGLSGRDFRYYQIQHLIRFIEALGHYVRIIENDLIFSALKDDKVAVQLAQLRYEKVEGLVRDGKELQVLFSPLIALASQEEGNILTQEAFELLAGRDLKLTRLSYDPEVIRKLSNLSQKMEMESWNDEISKLQSAISALFFGPDQKIEQIEERLRILKNELWLNEQIRYIWRGYREKEQELEEKRRVLLTEQRALQGKLSKLFKIKIACLHQRLVYLEKQKTDESRQKKTELVEEMSKLTKRLDI